jgi:hypothetical protein
MAQIADVSPNFNITNHGANRSFRYSIHNLIPMSTTQWMTICKPEICTEPNSASQLLSHCKFARFYASILKIEAIRVYSTDISLYFKGTIMPNFPVDNNLHKYCSENVKS